MATLTKAQADLLASLGFTSEDVEKRARALATAQAREAAADVLTPEIVGALLDVAGGVKKSSTSAWVGASVDRVPVTVDGQAYTVKVVITQK